MQQNTDMLEHIVTVENLLGSIYADSAPGYYRSTNAVFEYAADQASIEQNAAMLKIIEQVRYLTGRSDADSPEYYRALQKVLNYAKRLAKQGKS